MIQNSNLTNLFTPKAIGTKRYLERRKKLIVQVQADFPGLTGAIVLFGALEREAAKFTQESSYYYFSGITEPGTVLVINLDGTTTLFVPNTNQQRGTWVHQALEPDTDLAQQLGVDQIVYLGEPIKGFEFYHFFNNLECQNLLNYLTEIIAQKGQIFAINPNSYRGYFESRFLLTRVTEFLSDLINKNSSIAVSEISSSSLNIGQPVGHGIKIQDISGQIASLRRIKDQWEIGQIYAAIGITIQAQQRAAEFIQAGRVENEIQGMIEFTFTESGAGLAFPTIVGGGANSTVLHYTENQSVLAAGDLVVVDIGASHEHYCADLTRTYPVSGKFTKRQREIYNLVLEAQQYIADLAKPGVWLNNREYPENSLNHLAHKFIQERGYGEYFPHGVGHYLGLDVHDVGSYTATPLQVGDVITIEPGIYIPLEKLGVRIEDNYWITDKGAICLSEELPKTAMEVEQMMVAALEDAGN